jgi:hypothetical protein
MPQRVIEATYKNGQLILGEALTADLEGKKLRLTIEEVPETEGLSAEAEAEAQQRLLRYAGAIRLGHATGIENEAIDADLARAYENQF